MEIMEFGKYFKPTSQRQLDVKSKTTSLKSKSDAKTKLEAPNKVPLDPFGVPPMGWMPNGKIMSIIARRDEELRTKTRQD
jgi:hypothetical protein